MSGSTTPQVPLDPVTPLTWLASAVLWSLGLAWIVPSAIVMWIQAKTVGSHATNWYSHLNCRTQNTLTGCRWRCEVHPGVDPDRQYIFAQNHVNLLDYCVLYPATPHYKQGVNLESHFKVPFYGWFMKARGTIGVKKGKNRIPALTADFAKELEEGRSILVFPEGHRTLTGRMGPFKTGTFRIARDLGLGGVSLFGSFTAIILGVSLLYSEIQKRTIHTIVTKPLERHEFVIGKYAGMVITLSALVSLFALAMMLLLIYQGVPISMALIKALVLAYFEVLVVAAVAVFFSSFSTPFLSGIFTFGIFYVGRATPEIRAVVATSESDLVGGIMNAALFLVPDLHLFSVSGGSVDGQQVSVHGDFVSWGYTATSCAYGLMYIAVLMVLACLIFRRRDFV